MNPPQTDDPVRTLADRLKNQRRSLDSRSEEEVRDALTVTLDAALEGLGEREGADLLERLRDHLVADARERDQRLAAAEAEIRRLQSDSARLAKERDEARSRPPAAGAASTASVSASSPGLDNLREMLRRAAEGQDLPSDVPGLSPADARLFRLTSALLQFALNFEKGVNDLMMQIQVGQGGDTRLHKHREKVIKERFRACLEDRQGSVHALKEALERNSLFLPTLARGFETALRRGVPAILAEIDPLTLAEKNPARFGETDFKKAWKMFGDIHAELSALPPADLWERFFDRWFKEQLAEYLKGDGGGR
jgi:hypothetical protein